VAFGIIPTYLARGEVPAGELPNPMRTASLARAYDAGIRFVDEELGKFFGFLRERGILERSWVVITADHGEMIADSRFVFGHGVLDQDVMHVPLLIRPPGGYPGGKRIADAVQLVDLQPTLVELAGCAADARLHGRSLVPLLRSEARTSDVVLAEGGIVRQAMLIADGWKLVELEPAKESTLEARISNPLLARNFPPLAELDAKSERPRRRNLRWLDDLELRCDVFERMPATGLTDELLAQMKTRHGFPSFLVFIDDVLEGPFYELYDLTADPEAKHDVAAQHPEKVAALQALLGQEKRRRAKAWKLAQPPAKPVEFAPEEIQALEALGYVGDDE
jgi:arylsulfatase A-like enzyme